MSRISLPFSLDELRCRVDALDDYVRTAALQVMGEQMSPADLGFPSTFVDELAHLHGLLDLAKCCIEEIEILQRDAPKSEKSFRSGNTSSF